MSTTQITHEPTRVPSAGAVEAKLEVIVLPVSDAERAKRFYESLGWRLDADFAAGDAWRGVQMTPPGSLCSVIFGKGVTTAKPGSVQGLLLVVDDIAAARAELEAKGVVFKGETLDTGVCLMALFEDPDGNDLMLHHRYKPRD